jgi:FkbM family methyltransferase
LGGGLAAVVRAAAAPLDRRHRAKALAEASDRLAPEVVANTRLGRLRFRCPNAESSRIPTQFEAWEPETLAWIDEQVAAGDCLWDVGAHIGAFALYAGLKVRDGGGIVIAFEPSAANYAALNANIALNGLSGAVVAYCVALSNASGAGLFHMKDVGAGADLSAFGAAENVAGGFTPAFSQGAISFSMDDLAGRLKLRAPDHVKLDVDSIEAEILAGGSKTLKRVKSLLIEIDKTRDAAWRGRVVSMLSKAGLRERPAPGGASGRNILFARG